MIKARKLRGRYDFVKSCNMNTSKSMAMKYEKFNGYKSILFHLGEAEICNLSVAITSEAGNLNLSITDQNENSYYKGTGIPTSTFIIRLDKTGDYTIILEAENHKGGYMISWDMEKGNF